MPVWLEFDGTRFTLLVDVDDRIGCCNIDVEDVNEDEFGTIGILLLLLVVTGVIVVAD